MEVRKEVLVERAVDIVCDVCGKSCTESLGGPEYATLKAHWGYESNKDLEEHECHLCEGCYDKVKDFIEQTLNGKVYVYEYHIGSGERLGEIER